MSDSSGFTITGLAAGLTPVSAQVLMQDAAPNGLPILAAESFTWVARTGSDTTTADGFLNLGRPSGSDGGPVIEDVTNLAGSAVTARQAVASLDLRFTGISFAQPPSAVLEQVLPLLISDFIGGADPRQPTFSWRRRNLATAGAGEFSGWTDTTGGELFVTPVAG